MLLKVIFLIKYPPNPRWRCDTAKMVE